MSSSFTVAGIDVSKAKLDIYIHPLGIYKSFDNTIEAFEKIFCFLKQYNVGKVGLESTGGYEKLCAYALLTKGLEVYIIQAKWMRDYARSLGITVKTDKIDSNLIARYINNPDRRVTTLTVTHNTSVKELFCRREQLVEIIKIQKVQKQQINNSSIIIQIDNLIKILKTQIIDLEIQMIEIVKKTPELSQKYKLLISIPGIGNIVAISLLCYLPELGTLCSKQSLTANNRRSKIRALVEHVFAHQKHHRKLFIRTIGINRARWSIGLANLVYNFKRAIFHERKSSLIG